MAVIQVESVAITKSRLAKGFNGDNLNLGGKVVAADAADRGFKAAGSVKPPYFAVVASGNQKGFAAGAASAFNDYTKDIYVNKYNAQSVINSFFDDMGAVVEKCDIEGAKLSIGIVCVYEDCVVAAKTGDCHLLLFSQQGELFEIALPQDESSDRGFQFIDVISDGDIFALVGAEASADIDYDGVVNVFDSETDLKAKIKDMFKLFVTPAPNRDCTVVLAKLACDAERTYAAVGMNEPEAEVEFNEAAAENPEEFASEPQINSDELFEDSNYVSDSEMPETGKSPGAKKKMLRFIPIVILVILLAVAAGLYFATRPSDSKEPTSNPDGIVNGIFEDEEDNTGDFNGSHGMQTVDDTENGGNAGNLDEPEQETTTKRQEEETTTRRPEPETERPTAAPETTTEQSETTTEAPETTTEAPETTTEAPETTTEQPENNEPEEEPAMQNEPAGDTPESPEEA